MDSNKLNSNGQNASMSNGAASSPMASTGSKGRSGGSKFKSLLARLGHGNKSSKPGSGSATAGSSPAAGQVEASPSNAKGKADSTSRPGAGSPTIGATSGDKRASKPASTQRAGKVTPSKQDAKGKATASRDVVLDPLQQEHFKQPASINTSPQPGAGLPPVSTGNSVDYFGLKGALPADAAGEQQQRRHDNDNDNSSDLDALRYRAENPEDDDDEIDGADADASIRPITPSSIDASSSFTGSTSLHSLAPTSRTFKSFRTGYSKTSASTKPTLLGANGTSIGTPSAGGPAVNAPSISSPTSNAPHTLNDALASPPTSVHSLNQSRKDGPIGQSLTLQSDKQKEREKAVEATIDTPAVGSSSLGMVDMHDPDANRIATSIHGAEGTLPSSPRSVRPSAELAAGMALQPGPLYPARHGARASPLRNSFVGPISGLAVAPALSAAEEESETGSQIPQQATPRDTDWSEQQHGDNQEGPDSLRMPEAHRVESSNNMRSSASITFSKLPPATPSSISSAQLYSAPGSPGRLSSYTHATTGDRDHDEGDEDVEGIYHYPRHSAPDPRNNPRASSPPPDNASMLTLASSTGGRAPSVYTAASRYRDGFAGGGGGAGSIGGTPSIVDTAGNRYRTTANEDASIRAIAPSRRESTDSIGSKWSAAILSQREGSYHAPSASAQGAAAGDTTPDNASYKRRTPSLRTVATTASSYYAAPIAPPTELKV